MLATSDRGLEESQHLSLAVTIMSMIPASQRSQGPVSRRDIPVKLRCGQWGFGGVVGEYKS